MEKYLLAQNRYEVCALFDQAKDTVSPMEFAEVVITPALENIGRGWEEGAASLSQVYMSGRICEELMSQIFPENDNAVSSSNSRIAIAVLGDHHFLGKRMVVSALKSSGIKPVDFGQVDPVSLVEQVMANQIENLLISTLMMRSVLMVGEVAHKLADKRKRVKLVVGGAPFLMDAQLWKEVGADTMGRNASDAVSIVRGFERGRS